MKVSPEILDVEAWQVRPNDLLDEGRVVYQTIADVWGNMVTICSCALRFQHFDLGDGQTVWDLDRSVEQQSDYYKPAEVVRVARAVPFMLPAFTPPVAPTPQA